MEEDVPLLPMRLDQRSCGRRRTGDLLLRRDFGRRASSSSLRFILACSSAIAVSSSTTVNLFFARPTGLPDELGDECALDLSKPLNAKDAAAVVQHLRL